MVGVLTASLLGVAVAANAVDSMFPTANTNWTCQNFTGADARYCQQDNKLSTVFRSSSLTTTGRAEIADALGTYGGLDLNIDYVGPSEVVFSGPAETDVIIQANTQQFEYGITWCQSLGAGNKCDQHYVRFNTTTPLRAGVCHEYGHSVGLTHGDDASPIVSNRDGVLGCLRSPLFNDEYAIGANNVSQINAIY